MSVMATCLESGWFLSLPASVIGATPLISVPRVTAGVSALVGGATFIVTFAAAISAF